MHDKCTKAEAEEKAGEMLEMVGIPPSRAMTSIPTSSPAA